MSLYAFLLSPLVVSGSVAFLVIRQLIPRLRQKGFVGRDVHKPGSPEVPEMGGLAITVGFSGGLFAAIALHTFTDISPIKLIDPLALFAVMSLVLIISFVGLIDDLLGVPQGWKAFIPMLASLPLVVIKAGQTKMNIPLVGSIDFGIYYFLVLVPLGITGAANAVNMLAGFNGVEVGMGVVAIASLAVIAYTLREATALIILLAALGALLVILRFNWYPAKIFIGDVGTLSIGAIIAASVIVGNFETAGVILIIPYAVDLLFKAAYRFPKSFGELGEDGKLHCPKGGPVGLGQAIMKLTGGIHERTLTLALMGIELFFGLLAINLYVRW